MDRDAVSAGNVVRIVGFGYFRDLQRFHDNSLNIFYCLIFWLTFAASFLFITKQEYLFFQDLQLLNNLIFSYRVVFSCSYCLKDIFKCIHVS